jgi:hypothetical protein
VERWRAVLRYRGIYEVSTRGRVKSLARVTTGKNGTPRRLPERILKGNSSGSNGYVSVRLTDTDGGSKAWHVNVLVLEAFVGPRPDGLQSLHRDDIRTNNDLSNLYWGTFEDNAADKMKNGRNGNANKTRCPRGHEYTEANTRVYKGKRNCRACWG